MEEDELDGEKTEEPTSHRIEEFRKRGEVASSKELTSVLILLTCFMTLGLSLVFIYEVLSEFVEWIYSLDVAIAYTEKSQKTIVYKTIATALKCVAPIFMASFCMGVIANLIQIGFIFAPEVLTIKLNRINPISGVKRLFSIRSALEAIKGMFKFLIISTVVYFMLRDDVKTFSGFLHQDYVQTFLYGKDIIWKLSIAIILGLLVVAIADFGYQKYTYWQKLKMTKEEAKKELKEQEGNPEVRQRIRSIQREMSQKRMMRDVETADVVVTNPTHLSVALKYDKETMISPKVVAKGGDFLALKIREVAKNHEIPVVENVYLARSLYKTVKIGESVPRSLYKVVAEVLAFVYKLKNKNKI
jgi:flagellar biosynthetic protein FlhB